jgi:hypothetical protein
MADTPASTASPFVVPASTYEAKKFDNKYNVESLSYPADLMGSSTNGNSKPASQYGSNYVIFYINVNNDSKMLQNNPPDVTVDINASDRIKSQITAKNYTGTETAVANTAAGTITGAVTKGGPGAAVGAATGLGTTAAAGAFAAGFNRPQKRLKAAIALHTPNQLSITYGTNWGAEDTFAQQAMIDGARAAATAAKAVVQSAISREVAKGVDKIKQSANTGMAIGANAALKNTPGISAMTGLAPNPMKEQVFQGSEFRSFTFDYEFAPRNSVEAQNVLNIIKAFKYHMHPEYKDANNFLFLYPSEFDIVYYHDGQENLKIHRHTSCVLENLSVNYTPNGVFNTFPDGMPTQINISMSFKELALPTKELIKEGL